MELVGVSEAAALIGVNKSTISRQVAKGIIPNHAPAGKAPLINPEEALAARRGNIDTAKSATPGLGLRASNGIDLSTVEEQRPQNRLDFNTARTAGAAVDAKLKQLQYARETGLVVDKSRAEREAFNCARAIRDRLLAVPARIAGELAVLTDEREISARIRKSLLDVLSEVSAALEQDIEP